MECIDLKVSKGISAQLRQSPEYLQWLAINKWNGQMPYAFGSGAPPFFQEPKYTLSHT